MRTAIICHGCHLGADGWANIVWGRPESGILGRVPKALVEALKWNAEIVFFPTGASEKDGKKEGEYTPNYALSHAGELMHLLDESYSSTARDRIRSRIMSLAVLELKSQSTREEVGNCAELALRLGIKRFVLVSSPTHIMRCHQAAISVLRGDRDLRVFLDNLYVVASDTSYADSNVDDVVIIEPPHRGDMPKVPFHKTAKGIFPFLRKPEVAFEFNGAWGRLIDEYMQWL